MGNTYDNNSLPVLTNQLFEIVYKDKIPAAIINSAFVGIDRQVWDTINQITIGVSIKDVHFDPKNGALSVGSIDIGIAATPK